MSDADVVIALVEQMGVPVFPCRQNDKKPFPGSHGFYDATRDVAQIRRWAQQNPRCNWAMPTGSASGIFVVDVDERPEEGKHGEETLQKHVEKHGPLPQTVELMTPSGGRHLWFRANGTPLKSAADALGNGLDTRGEGGYVIIPPSQIDGREYAFEASSDPADVGLADVPAWVVKILVETSDEKDPGSGNESSGVELLDNILAGKSLHDSTRSLAASLAARGIRFAEICTILRLAMQQSAAPRDQRWNDRFKDIPHLVHSAIEKYAKTGSSAPEIRFDPEAARIGDVFENRSPPPRFLIDQHLPFNVGREDGTGGISKSTRHQWEHIHLLLGEPLYGRRVLFPGPTLVLTKEDSRDDYRFRYQQIGIAMNLTPAQRRGLTDIRVEDLTGTGCRLANSDMAGNLVASDVAESIVKAYRGAGIVLIDIDPLVFFSPGERFVNDGEAIIMEVGRFISRDLNCAVRFTSHVSKEAARGRFVDAHAGRGGSAGGDNARFVHVLVHHDPTDEKAYARPEDVTDEAVIQRRILRLHVPKVSGAPPVVDPIWIERDGFLFRHLHGTPATEDQREAADVARLKDFLADELQRGIKHTRHSLEDSLEPLKLSRKRLRRALYVAEQKGHVVQAELPEDERRGGKKAYFRPVGVAR